MHVETSAKHLAGISAASWRHLKTSGGMWLEAPLGAKVAPKTTPETMCKTILESLRDHCKTKDDKKRTLPGTRCEAGLRRF